MKLCFIGHRQIFESTIREKLKTAVETEIKNGCKLFTMGTKGEFDRLALSVCRELRKTYKNIEIEVVIASYHQIENNLLSVCKTDDGETELFHENYTPFGDVKTIMYDLTNTHFKRQIIESNRQMIETCDTLICYVNENRTPSGASRAMNYAKQKGLKIINLYTK